MAIQVRIPSMLLKFTDGEKLLQYDSPNVGALLSSI